MNLAVEIETITDPASGRSAAGFVVWDADASRAIHEAAHLTDDTDELLVAYHALLRVLGLVTEQQAERVEIRCTSTQLVDQITGSEAPAAASELYEQALMQLLKLDSWSLVARERGHGRRAAQLAQEAIERRGDVVPLAIEQASVQQKRKHTGVPQWTVQLLDDPGDACPARCKAEVRYAFGPDTPAGFCVYAAAVALADGPLDWTDAQQTRMTTSCPHCHMPLRITVVK